jgi:adenylyltransferase/sulfurtransferase
MVPSCAEGGVLVILPGIVGLFQANEAVKLILGKGETLVGRLLLFDALTMKFREMKLKKDKNCPICGDNPTITELIDYEEFCGIVPVEASPEDDAMEIGVEQVKQMMDNKHAFRLIDVREPSEYDICKIGGAILIPLGDIEAKDLARLNGLNPDEEIVLHCKAGVRSMKAVKALKEMGFKNLKSMRGGINEWSEKIDSSVPLY